MINDEADFMDLTDSVVFYKLNKNELYKDLREKMNRRQTPKLVEEIIIPYGSGSLVSCDSTGNYFNLDMKSLLADRFYRVEYKIVSGSGTADETNTYIDEGFTFKVSL